MTLQEKRKLELDVQHSKPHLDILEPFAALAISEKAVRDEINTLQQSNEQLREQLAILQSRNEELDAYAHTVAHDLKNPLSVIIMTTYTFFNINDLKSEKLDEFLKQIRATAHEMNSIIDNLLLLSEVHKMGAPLRPVDMTNVVERICMRLEYLVEEYRARISYPETWPVAIGYAPWIEEVWANYLSNALKYGGQPPHVELGASLQSDGMIRFWTRDHGPGLPQEIQARLFAPFTQFSKVHKPGHGLGLSIARRIVEKLGGQVGVESEIGKGSLFFFTLPASSIELKPVFEKSYNI